MSNDVEPRVLFQLTGSIACFKACELISRLVKRGVAVETVASEGALRFVGAATLEGLTGRRPFTDLYEAGRTMDHIRLARWADVEVLWTELREWSPDAARVTEGRIVAAGALADRGREREAVRLLATSWALPKRPQPHHLRRGYALADLYERTGALARARELFIWVSRHDPRFADVRSRVSALS